MWLKRCSVIACILLQACGSQGGREPIANPVAGSSSSASAGSKIPEFSDISSLTGMDFGHGYLSFNGTDVEKFAGGVAVGDVNGDGLLDFVFTRGNIGQNLLYINQGGNTYIERAQQAGIAYTAGVNANNRHSGPTLADIDGDGDLDLFLGAILGDDVKIFENNGMGEFEDVTHSSGLSMEALNTIGAAFGDYDQDGDLDLLLSHWGVERKMPGEDTETLWENVSTESGIRFESVSIKTKIAESLIEGKPGVMEQAFGGGPYDYSFTPSFARMNDDLYPDVLIVSDFGNTKYFLNTLGSDNAREFQDATNYDEIKDENGMGSVVADLDGDGDLDWMVTGIYGPLELIGNRYYENVGDGVLRDRTSTKGVIDGGWGWGACSQDFDLDGDLEIYHTNGWEDGFDEKIYERDRDRMFALTNSERYVNLSSIYELNGQYQGRGVVCGDFDNDGDIDIVVSVRDSVQGFVYLENLSAVKNYLKIELVGEQKNTQAANARIYVTTSESVQMREILIGSNFTSQNPVVQIFGLGDLTGADEVLIEWPNGEKNNVGPLGVGTYTFKQAEIN